MSGIQAAVPLQLMCQLLTAGLVTQNVTVSLNPTRTVAETIDPAELPPGYVAFPEIGFAYKVSDDALTYNEARKMCLNENTQLAVLDTREKVAKILNNFDYGYFLSIGLVRTYGTDEWTTIDGKSTSNLPWASGEPTGDGNCAYLSRRSEALCNEACSELNKYLCEIPLPRK